MGQKVGYFAPEPPKAANVAMSVSICLSVCLSARVSQNHTKRRRIF